MEMRGKECFWPGRRFPMQVFENCPGDRTTISRTGAPSNLIKDDETFFSHIVENICQFQHFDKKSALAASKIIKCTDPGKNTVDKANTGKPGRYKTPSLGHNTTKSDRAHIRG